ncbi:MAG: c-type cytochrome [Roseovarius sp.]|nr:c-type cytochrome [Roseovarius sp.]MCY4208240.1 c-type cytochrome [Roseovarius sp.]
MMRITALVLGGLMLAGTAHSGDGEAGRKVAGQCRTCHGIDGFARIPIAPHIGGEPVEYIASQLMAFKSGKREHEMMSLVSRILTDENIEDVSKWYGNHTAKAVLPNGFDPEQAPELCTSCHGADGIAVIENTPHLAAESAIYIDTQLKAFRNGKREHEIMSEIAANMSDEEIRAAADWYAAIGLEIVPK